MPETVQHPADLDRLRAQLLPLRALEETGIAGELELVLQFHRRPNRDLKESSELRLRACSATFDDVEDNGLSGPEHLGSQRGGAATREAAKDLPNGESVRMRPRPHIELAEVLHGANVRALSPASDTKTFRLGAKYFVLQGV